MKLNEIIQVPVVPKTKRIIADMAKREGRSLASMTRLLIEQAIGSRRKHSPETHESLAS